MAIQASQRSSIAAERYAATARAAGCPRDQIERFARAGVVLQPKQLMASAAARMCDLTGGPVEIGYGGARGGGKSHWLLAQIGADDCQRCPGLKALILRKVGKAVREGIQDLRQRVLCSLPHEYRQQEGAIRFQNGSRIIVGHFQAEKDIDAYLGLEYDVIGVEEATTLTASKYRMIRTCNRTSKPNWRPRMYSTTNPGGVGHAWYKKTFIEPFERGEETETRFISATVDDNHFINPEYLRTLDALTGWEKRAWRFGDWDIAAGQFFTTFRRDLHVIPAFEIPAAWRKWAAMDYGFTHYTVVYLGAQDGDGNVYIVDEHAERRWLPQRHAPAIKAMLARSRTGLHQLQRFVAGADVFAKRPTAEDQPQTIADTYSELGIHLEKASDDRISGAAEMLSRLGDADSDPPIPPRLFIFDRCIRLVETLPALQHDPHRPEDVLKIDCDEDGRGGDDAYDCFVAGTPVLTSEGEKPIEQVRPGDLVLTRGGWRRGKAVWNSRRNAPVLTVRLSNGRSLTGTPNHRFWVCGRGWVQLDSLRYGDNLFSPCQIQAPNQKQSYSAELPFDATQGHDVPTCGITTGRMATGESVGLGRCTSKSGSRSTERFPRAATSTTWTGTRSTTRPRTWSASLRAITSSITSILTDWSRRATILMRSGRWPMPGINPRKGERGTVGIPRGLCTSQLPVAYCASNAGSGSTPPTGIELASVPAGARQLGVARPVQTMWSSPASTVVSRSAATNTCERGSALVFVLGIADTGETADTWALEVDEIHEYFAAGVLVRNSCRYLIMEAKINVPAGFYKSQDSGRDAPKTFAPRDW